MTDPNTGFDLTRSSLMLGLSRVWLVDYLSRSKANVLFWGADKTGAQDSSTAIQSAIDSSDNGGYIYFPPGSYLVSQTCIANKTVKIVGDNAVIVVSDRTKNFLEIKGSIASSSAVSRIDTVNNIEVRAATTGNINLAAPGATIDGVSMDAGTWFLAKDQAAPAENGIYLWLGAATPATRAFAADSAAGLATLRVACSGGTVNGVKAFYQDKIASAITVGTTALTFTEVAWKGTHLLQSASAITTDKIAKIYSDDNIPNRLAGNHYRMGQLVKVSQTGNGTYIVIDNEIYEPNLYTTNIRIAEILTVNDCEISGITFTGDGTTTEGTNKLLYLENTRDAKITECVFHGSNFQCSESLNGWNVVVDRCVFRDTVSASRGYGFSFVVSSGNMNNCVSSNTRHPIVCDGLYIYTEEFSDDAVKAKKCGWAHDIVCTGHVDTGSKITVSLDTHTAAYSVSFVACTVNANSGGIVLRGWNCLVDGCNLTSANDGIVISCDVSDNPAPVPIRNKARIFGSKIKAETPIRVAQAGSAMSDSVIVSGCTLETIKSSWRAIFIDQIYGWSVKGCNFTIELNGKNFVLIHADRASNAWNGVVEDCEINIHNGAASSNAENFSIILIEGGAQPASFGFIKNTINRAGKPIHALFLDPGNVLSDPRFVFSFDANISGITNDYIGSTGLVTRAYSLAWNNTDIYAVGNNVLTYNFTLATGGIAITNRNGHKNVLLKLTNGFGANVDLVNIDRYCVDGAVLRVVNTNATYNVVIKASGAQMNIGSDITLTPLAATQLTWDHTSQKWLRS